MSQLPQPVRTGRPAQQQTTARQFAFRPASKAGRKARLSIQGMSGSGKTWTGLSITHGLSEGRKLRGHRHREEAPPACTPGTAASSSTPAHGPLRPPRPRPRPRLRRRGRLPAVFVDSLSHFWKGTDGTLDQVEKAKSKYGGNKFAGWKDGTPLQNDMVAAILDYPGHVVCSMRSYTEWVLENGKPQRVGMRPEQRKGIEYEFDVAVAMDLDNQLEVLKSRCPDLHRKVIQRPTAPATSPPRSSPGSPPSPAATE
jgi:hypothetical protein